MICYPWALSHLSRWEGCTCYFYTAPPTSQIIAGTEQKLGRRTGVPWLVLKGNTGLLGKQRSVGWQRLEEERDEGGERVAQKGHRSSELC